MHHLAAVLHTLGVRLTDTTTRRAHERGSVTIEQVLWAVAMIATAQATVSMVTEPRSGSCLAWFQASSKRVFRRRPSRWAVMAR